MDEYRAAPREATVTVMFIACGERAMMTYSLTPKRSTKIGYVSFASMPYIAHHSCSATMLAQ